MPNLYKVGRTYGTNNDGYGRIRDAYDRIKDTDLNCTGVPGRFKVEEQMYTINTRLSEITAHKNLEGRVISSEFFQYDCIEKIKKIVSESVHKIDSWCFQEVYNPVQKRIWAI
jgi:hypothetical protein